MNTQHITPAVITFLKKQPLYSTMWSNRIDSEVEVFHTLDEAQAIYNNIDVMEVTRESDSYWRNNKEGYEAELRVITELPVSMIDELNECETEEEMSEIMYKYSDPHHDYADRIETKFSYLSDEFDENLGKNGEFVIKEKKVPGITYGTHFGDKEKMIKLSDII